MNTFKLNVRTLLVSGTLALAGLLLTQGDAQAQKSPKGGNNPPQIELPGGGSIEFRDITAFSMKLNFFSPVPRSNYVILISGRGQSGRIESLSYGSPRKRGSKVLNRLLPDTTYDIAVQARSRRGFTLVAKAKAKTASSRPTPSTDPCNSARITVRNVSASQADLFIAANCKFQDFEVIVAPMSGNGAVKRHTVRRSSASKRASYNLDGLAADTRYKINVRRLESSSQSAPLGDGVVFTTLK